MSEEKLQRSDFSPGPDTGPDPFDSEGAGVSGSVEVIHGIYAHSQPIAGMTVRQARCELEESMNIDPDAMAVVDGHEVKDDAVLAEGQVLNFVKHAGEKG
jgi:hypothetical protein